MTYQPPDWMEQELSENAKDELAKVKLPSASLGKLIRTSEMDLSDGYTYLKAVADMIYNLAIYPGHKGKNLKNGLWVIEMVREDLVLAEVIFKEDLAKLEETNNE